MSPPSLCKLPTAAWFLLQGLIFVVDSNDRERVQESADELQKMVSDGGDSIWQGRGCPPALLLLAQLCSNAWGGCEMRPGSALPATQSQGHPSGGRLGDSTATHLPGRGWTCRDQEHLQGGKMVKKTWF